MKKQQKVEKRIWRKICPYCKKEFMSLNKNVVENNYIVHLAKCRSEKRKAKQQK